MVVRHKGTGSADAVKRHIQRPVLLRYKCSNLVLTVYHEPGSHRLDSSGRQTAADLLPQQGRQLITHDPIQDTAGLLGIHQIIIDAAGIADRFLHHPLGDLIKRDPMSLLIRQTQQFL